MSAIKSTRETKGFQTQIEKLAGDSHALNEQIRQLQKEKSLKENKIKELNDKINSMKNEIKISEHALIRYVERIHGIDVKEIESKILPENVKEQIKTLGGTGKFPVGDFSIAVKNYTVTTILI